jgi:metal-sulfur cluster biosynthetic enzyme
MDEPMRKTIDGILERVKEPETLRSLADLSLVKRVRYSAAAHTFEIFLDVSTPRTSCFVCGVVTASIQKSIERELTEAFTQDFPGCQVIFS